ncbi:MAG: hypothetical protein QXF02_02535 [Candidatus Korarchaeota archaeon]
MFCRLKRKLRQITEALSSAQKKEFYKGFFVSLWFRENLIKRIEKRLVLGAV